MEETLDIEGITYTLRQALSDVTTTKVRSLYTSEIFTLFFMENFLSDSPGAINQIHGASQSNWTYHTAFAVKKTASVLGLNSIFETNGRLDAVICTNEDNPEILLFAEWEAKHQSIFDTGKELDKLWQGAVQHKKADAFLFTYCPKNEYPAFLKEVVKYWQRIDKRRKRRPILYLVTFVYERAGNIDKFQYVSAVEIHHEGVNIWGNMRSANAPF